MPTKQLSKQKEDLFFLIDWKDRLLHDSHLGWLELNTPELLALPELGEIEWMSEEEIEELATSSFLKFGNQGTAKAYYLALFHRQKLERNLEDAIQTIEALALDFDNFDPRYRPSFFWALSYHEEACKNLKDRYDFSPEERIVRDEILESFISACTSKSFRARTAHFLVVIALGLKWEQAESFSEETKAQIEAYLADEVLARNDYTSRYVGEASTFGVKGPQGMIRAPRLLLDTLGSPEGGILMNLKGINEEVIETALVLYRDGSYRELEDAFNAAKALVGLS